MADDCVFCKIIAGELPAHRVLEDEDFVAFLDVRPLFPGHVLLIPKRHMVTLDELDPQEVTGLFEKLRVISRAAVISARLSAIQFCTV